MSRHRITRRSFLSGAACVVLAAPRAAEAQVARNARLGILLYSTPQEDPTLPSFLQQLRELGYTEGKTLSIEYRFAEGKRERLPEAAAALVRLRPDAIYALGGDVVPAILHATRTIPIIAVISNDPVRAGFAASLARPGGNITGGTLILEELAGRRLELLKQIMPSLSRVGVLWNPEHADPEFRELQRAARALTIRLESLEVRRGEDFDAAFELATAAKVQALVVVSSRLVNLHRQRILDFGAKQRLPVVGDWGRWALSGAVLQYGPNPVELARRSAIAVDRVLKGAKPADLPFERPTKFELIVNVTAAKSFGLTIPAPVLLQADQVHE